MPIYEYQCEDCGERTEVLQRISDPPLAECPECQGEVRKLISAPAFQFKGSGWYVTDYARGSDGKEGAAEAGKDAKDTGDDGAAPAKADTDKVGENKASSKPDSKVPAEAS